jgi:Spatacsin C-terminus
MSFLRSMFCWQVGFEDMLLYSTSQVLERLFAVPSLERLSLAKRCLVSFKANTVEVTAFISSYVTEMLKNGLVKPNADPKSLGDSIKPYLTVALDLVSLGNHLIDAATGTRSDANLRLHTELLVAAHEVLTKAGTLEGLARLLAACKTVSKALADAQDYHSLLRLLNGVGRYSELTFIFHLIKEADKMEILFGRGVEKDPKLKNAILNYLRKFHADDSNTFEMLAAAYSMHREIGETFLAIAQDKMALFKHRPIVDTAETQAELKRIAQFLMDAANSFSRAECYSRTERCIEQARLVALQVRLPW